MTFDVTIAERLQLTESSDGWAFFKVIKYL